MVQINTFLDVYGLFAIFVVLLLKSMGIPIPIPFDAVLLAAAARVTQGRLVLWQAFIAILIALVVGGTAQFLLARGPGRRGVYRFGRYLGLTPARLDAAAMKVKKGGVVGLSIALMTPGLRSVAITAAGLVDLPLPVFLGGLTLGSALFLAFHFGLGYAGQLLLSNLTLPVAAGIVITLLVIGAGIWLVIRLQHPSVRTVCRTIQNRT